MNRFIVLAIATVIMVTAGVLGYKHVISGYLSLVMVMLAVRLCSKAGRMFNKKGIR